MGRGRGPLIAHLARTSRYSHGWSRFFIGDEFVLRLPKDSAQQVVNRCMEALDLHNGKQGGGAGLERIIERFRSDIRNDLVSDRLVCPSLPDVALKVRKVMENPKATANDITRTVATDPALSAQVLRVANSVYYHGGDPVSDLQRAVVRLGNHVVQHVVMLLVVSQIYNVRSRPGIKPHLVRLWHHSTLVATISQLLTKRFTQLQPEVAMLGGLIHDIGTFPILVRAEKIPQVISEPRILQPLIGSLHTEVGRAILEQWRFPSELVAVASEHEDLQRSASDVPDYVDVVQVGNLLSYMDSEHRLAQVDWSMVPAVGKLAVTQEIAEDIVDYAASKVATLRSLLR